jgi:hypothetical protein
VSVLKFRKAAISEIVAGARRIQLAASPPLIGGVSGWRTSMVDLGDQTVEISSCKRARLPEYTG